MGSALSRRRREALEDINTWTLTSCCIHQPCCVDKIGLENSRDIREEFLSSSCSERKKRLLEIVEWDEEKEKFAFFIGRVKPCWNYVCLVLDVSRTLIANVLRLPSANASHLPGRLGGVSSSDSKTASVIAFLTILADEVCDEIPNSPERHLPHGNKHIVYMQYNHNELSQRREPCRPSHFYRTWKTHLPTLKCRRSHGFSACDTCVSFKDRLFSLARIPGQRQTRNALLNQFKLHLNFIRVERACYAKNRMLGKENPNSVFSVIIDGADQAKFGLPRFAEISKRETGNSLKQKVTGVIFHGAVMQRDFISFFTAPENVPGGENQTIDAFCRSLFAVLEKRNALGAHTLPSTLYIQLDNTSKDNKNRFFFSFCELLVHKDVFRSITLNFLPVGQTHEDIDRKFSHISTHVRYESITSIPELHNAIRLSQGSKVDTHVLRLQEMNNFSGALIQQKLVSHCRVNITSYRKFIFEQDKLSGISVESFEGFKVICRASQSMTDSPSQWTTIPKEDGNIGSFLIRVPDMQIAPSIKLNQIGEKELHNFQKRIRSTEMRVNHKNKTDSLYQEIMRLRNDKFLHADWDLNKLFSLRISSEDIETPVLDDPPVDNLEYAVGYLVTVNCGDNATAATPFWVGEIMNVNQATPRVEKTITVHWYEVYSSTLHEQIHCFTGKYRKMHTTRNINLCRSEIPVSSVYSSFPQLTSRHQIPAVVQRYTQEQLYPFDIDE